jgi:hypothetical protein
LRLARAADEAWLRSWLPAAVKALGYGSQAAARRSLIERDGEATGIAIYRERAPSRSSALIMLIATPVEMARRGAGMRAAVLLEDQFRARGMRTIYAPAPGSHGIAVYFWLRLGYRPLQRGDWPCAREGVVWLMRRLDP